MTHAHSDGRSPARALRWGVALAVVILAAVLRFWQLDRIDALIFDELYYVRDAITQLAHGYPTTWLSADPAAFGSHHTEFTADAAPVSHPPLGKWLIGLGVLLFGAETGWGWRSAAATFGTLTVALTMLLGWRLTRNGWIACVAGFLLAIDGVHVVLSRVALLDVFLTFFVLLGALFVWEDLHATAPQHRSSRASWVLRPWLWAAAASFGAASAVKWSGLFAFVGFGILLIAVDAYRRHQRREPHLTWRVSRHALGTLVTTVPILLAVYVASWLGWILSPGGAGRIIGAPWWHSLWIWHTNSVGWHSTLTAAHPYQAAPITWPLGIRPTGMYLQLWDAAAGCNWAGGCAAAVTPLPNLVVTWGGVVALALLLWILVRALRRPVHTAAAHTMYLTAGLTLTGYLSGWAPWVLLVSRSAVFQFYAVVTTPFAALALALVLGAVVTARPRAPEGQLFTLAGRTLDAHPTAQHSRRLAVACYLAGALVVACLFAPVWSGAPVAEWFWRAHQWLPGWR